MLISEPSDTSHCYVSIVERVSCRDYTSPRGPLTVTSTWRQIQTGKRNARAVPAVPVAGRRRAVAAEDVHADYFREVISLPIGRLSS